MIVGSGFVSWGDFLQFLIIILPLYYVVILGLYFRTDILRLITGGLKGRKRQTGLDLATRVNRDKPSNQHPKPTPNLNLNLNLKPAGEQPAEQLPVTLTTAVTVAAAERVSSSAPAADDCSDLVNFP